MINFVLEDLISSITDCLNITQCSSNWWYLCVNVLGRSQLTNVSPPRAILHGCYDCGDGFYDPGTRVVFTDDYKFIRHAGSYHESLYNCSRVGFH